MAVGAPTVNGYGLKDGQLAGHLYNPMFFYQNSNSSYRRFDLYHICKEKQEIRAHNCGGDAEPQIPRAMYYLSST